MTHNDLVNEATRQLSVRFYPQPNDIKKRIEHLIEVHLASSFTTPYLTFSFAGGFLREV